MKKFIGFSAFLVANVLSVVFVFSIISTANAQVTSGGGGGGEITVCPAGYTCTPIPTQPVNCPSGFICTTTNPISTPGTAGTISINQKGSYVFNGVTLNIGAGNSSDMKVSSITTDFNTRAWLYFSSISLVNQTTGRTIASASLNNSNFTEIVAGQDYRYNFGGLNFTIPRGQKVSLVLDGSLATSVGNSLGTTTQVISASVSAVDSNGVTQTVSTNSSSGGGGGSCYYWSANMSIGSIGSDVVALQTWLIAEGYDISAISGNRTTKGYYGISTAAAVAKLQATVGLPVTGYVGSQTLAYLNKNACGTTPTPISGNGIVATLDSASPQAGIVQISTSAPTNNVPLAVFDIKSQGKSSTLQGLTLGVIVNGGNTNISNFFTNLQIKVGGQMFAETSIASDNKSVSFTNFSVPLPANTYVPITVLGSVAQDTNNSLDGSNALVELPVSSIVAIDSNYNNVSTEQGLVTGNTITFNGSGVEVSNTSATLGGTGSCSVATNICTQNFSFTFTLTAGNSPIYTSNTSSLVQSVASANVGVNYASLITSSGSQSYDGPDYYMIPHGTSRTFTLNGVMTSNGKASVGTNQITSINYGTSPSNSTSNSITSGLQNLQVAVSFNGGTTTQPTITSISPTSGPAGSMITIYGNNFQTGSGIKVSGPGLNNMAMIPNSVSLTQIVGYMPSQATLGTYAIYISNGNSLSNTVNFTVTSLTQISQPPVISGGTFPTQLNVGQTGTWSVSASDPQNGSLSYFVNWGDNGTTCPVGYTCSNAVTAQSSQTSTFTHSYSSAGNYTITFIVTNSAGLSANTSTTVNVITAPTTILPVCPAGYVCTPPGQTYSCPSGYTCTNQTANCPSEYTCYNQTRNSGITPIASPSPTTVSTTYSLGVANSGNGVITSVPSGISCGSACSMSGINPGTKYKLTATPNIGYTTTWYGCNSSSGNDCNIIVNSNTAVKVLFSSVPVITPAIQPPVDNSTDVTASIWNAIKDYFAGR